jgi:hypothetical protein
MKHVLRRRDSDALLDGETLGTDAELDDVEAFLADMRLEFSALPAPEPRPTLAATLDGRRELRPASGPVPKPTIPKPGPKVHYRFRPIAAMLVSGVVLFGGLATAGALPGPLQRATADATSHLGIHLPGDTTTTPAVVPTGTGHRRDDSTTTPDARRDHGSGTAATTPQPSSGATGTTVVPPVTRGSATPTTTPTVQIPPPLTTTPTLPVPVPNLGTVPRFTPLPSIPGLVAPTEHLGVLRHHKVP